MNTTKKIFNYFKESYENSRLAFYCEVGETILLVTGSAVLSFTILDPATKIFVPLYLVGSVLAMISTYIRRSSAILLVTWFAVMNTWAFIQLFMI
tara:strand:+ start:505 stop:789 length:285 start_codon:yes stop_codon:yes gene_type:complete